MRYVKPHYYDKFSCTAGQCPDTCCAEWLITIDDASLERYAGFKSGFGSRLAGAIDWEEGCFLQYKGRCSLLNENGLCDMVAELGEEYLCETCSRYPRHVEEFKGVRELSLSLSCPAAAEIILGCGEGLRLLQEEDEVKEPLKEEFEDFDLELFHRLQEWREILFRVIQDKETEAGSTEGNMGGGPSIERRMHMALELAGRLQICVDAGKASDMNGVLREFSTVYNDGIHEGEHVFDEKRRFFRMREGFAVLQGLERLRDEWEEVLSGTWNTLYARGEAHYLKVRGIFLKEYGAGGRFYEDWNRFLENLLLFFLYTYFCGAVYDDWVYSKVALAVFSAVYIQEFVMFCYISSDKSIDKGDWVELAYRYAREIEHSDNNLNLLEELLQNSRLA